MTPEEKQQKLALVASHARQVNRHLNVDPTEALRQGMTAAVEEARREAGLPPLARPVEKGLDTPASGGDVLQTALRLVRSLRAVGERVAALERA